MKIHIKPLKDTCNSGNDFSQNSNQRKLIINLFLSTFSPLRINGKSNDPENPIFKAKLMGGYLQNVNKCGYLKTFYGNKI